MTASLAAFSILALLSALASWWSAPAGAGTPSLVRVIAARLAVWVAVGAAGVAALRFGSDDNRLFLAAWGAATVAVAVLAGRLLALARAAPRGLKWVLAPYIGVALWAHWVSGLVSHATRRVEPARGEAAPEATPEPRRGVRELASLTVGEVMVPRSEVVAIEAKTTVERAASFVRQAPHALYPVYDSSFDQPLGMLRMLDLAAAGDPGRPVRELVRDATLVPATMRGLALLSRLVREEHPAAVVIDEFGGVAGFVALEDLVEVVIGDLIGEHETERRRIQPLSAGAWRVEGSCRVDEFNAAAEMLLPEGEYDTVAGLFLDRSGHIPDGGEEVLLPLARLEVEAATDRRVLWLRVERLAGAAPRPTR